MKHVWGSAARATMDAIDAVRAEGGAWDRSEPADEPGGRVDADIDGDRVDADKWERRSERAFWGGAA